MQELRNVKEFEIFCLKFLMNEALESFTKEKEEPYMTFANEDIDLLETLTGTS